MISQRTALAVTYLHSRAQYGVIIFPMSSIKRVLLVGKVASKIYYNGLNVC